MEESSLNERRGRHCYYGSPNTEDYVWKKAFHLDNNDYNQHPELSNNPDNFRKDVYGRIIQKDKHGDTNHPYGWQIDHCISQYYCQNHEISEDKMNSFINLQSFNCKTNEFWGQYLIYIDENHHQHKKQVILYNFLVYQRVDYTKILDILRDGMKYFSRMI